MHDFYISIFRWNFWSKYLSWKLGWNEEKIVWSLYKHYAVCITLYHYHFLLHCNYSKIGGESGTSTRSSKVLIITTTMKQIVLIFFQRKFEDFFFEKNVCSIHPTIISNSNFIWIFPLKLNRCKICSLCNNEFVCSVNSTSWL